MIKLSTCRSLQWRHYELDGVSNHRRLHCLLICWFGRRSKKTSKHRVTGLCAGNSPVYGEFPAQKANNAENVSIVWRHHVPTGLGYTRCPSKIQLKLHIREISFFWNYALYTKRLRNLGLKSVSYDRTPSTVRRRLDIDPTVSDICLIDVDSRIFIIWDWCINYNIASRTMDITPKYGTYQNRIVGIIHDL